MGVVTILRQVVNVDKLTLPIRLGWKFHDEVYKLSHRLGVRRDNTDRGEGSKAINRNRDHSSPEKWRGIPKMAAM